MSLAYRKVTTESGRKRIHLARAERAFGRPLPPRAVVHHADGTRRDDAPLVICQDQRYHFLLHARMRVKAAGGDPNTDAICGRCRGVKPRTEFRAHRTKALGVGSYCLDCCREYETRGSVSEKEKERGTWN